MTPNFGYRYLAEEARTAGEPIAERTAWRICTTIGCWSVFGKKRGKNGKAGPPVHDDLVERHFTAEAPNQLWLADITEHPTREGNPYLCAVKDAFSNRIVGYSIDSPMKSRLATTALSNARGLIVLGGGMVSEPVPVRVSSRRARLPTHQCAMCRIAYPSVFGARLCYG